METAILGGGCFWCLEAALRQLEGVESVVSGYCGGHFQNPTYEEVCSGDSGHAEVVQVRFDPAVIDYRTLLQAFFAIHDPTTPDRQGNDVGTQYRSVIFTSTPEQDREAHRLIGELAADRVWPRPIVTKVQPAAAFWPAEAYHQDYFAHHPMQPYCVGVVAPKVAKLREKFAARIRRANLPK
jgi:peptide-methionine (S)-S-oxide reductase